jgi:FKBP12-rapamycin complex-associated protein
MLLGMDPAKNTDNPIPTTNPQVTFAYLKHMWKNNQKVRVFTSEEKTRLFDITV